MSEESAKWEQRVEFIYIQDATPQKPDPLACGSNPETNMSDLLLFRPEGNKATFMLLMNSNSWFLQVTSLNTRTQRQ